MKADQSKLVPRKTDAKDTPCATCGGRETIVRNPDDGPIRCPYCPKAQRRRT